MTMCIFQSVLATILVTLTIVLYQMTHIPEGDQLLVPIYTQALVDDWNKKVYTDVEVTDEACSPGYETLFY